MLMSHLFALHVVNAEVHIQQIRGEIAVFGQTDELIHVFVRLVAQTVDFGRVRVPKSTV